jgi:TatA/E family protein of Tat protein translocase
MLGLGAGEIFLILAFALIFIGPKKLPELARSLGKGVKEFQNAKDELLNQVNNPTSDDEASQITEVSLDESKEKESKKNNTPT